MVRFFFQGIRQGLSGFASLLADSINLVLLSGVYVLGVGITAAVAKLLKKKFLELQPKNEQSFWREVETGRHDSEDYFYRMF